MATLSTGEGENALIPGPASLNTGVITAMRRLQPGSCTQEIGTLSGKKPRYLCLGLCSQAEELLPNSEEEKEDREGLTCAVCLDVYVCPHVCRPCGHSFCEPCLRTIASKQPTNTPCPLCRTLISHADLNKGERLADVRLPLVLSDAGFDGKLHFEILHERSYS